MIWQRLLVLIWLCMNVAVTWLVLWDVSFRSSAIALLFISGCLPCALGFLAKDRSASHLALRDLWIRQILVLVMCLISPIGFVASCGALLLYRRHWQQRGLAEMSEFRKPFEVAFAKHDRMAFEISQLIETIALHAVVVTMLSTLVDPIWLCAILPVFILATWLASRWLPDWQGLELVRIASLALMPLALFGTIIDDGLPELQSRFLRHEVIVPLPQWISPADER